jgi:hypothetical protein
MKLFAITFICSQIFSAGIAWLGGYDFDHRAGYVALAAIVSVVFGGLFAWTVVSTAESSKQEKLLNAKEMLLNEKEKLLNKKEKLTIERLKEQA